MDVTSGALRKGEWSLSYDDGSDKVAVSFDMTSEHCPAAIGIQYSPDQWVYVDAEDAAWVAARLLDAAAAIAKALSESGDAHA
jgi:hypothetical protein